MLSLQDTGLCILSDCPLSRAGMCKHVLTDPHHRSPSKDGTLNQCCFNVGPLSATLGQHQNNIGSMAHVCWSPPSCTRRQQPGHNPHPSKHGTLTQCWFNVGPASQTLVQQWTSIGSMSRAHWDAPSTNDLSKLIKCNIRLQSTATQHQVNSSCWSLIYLTLKTVVNIVD